MAEQLTELINYRMQQKRDFTQKWSDSSFVPKDGEIIVYKDADSIRRIKIGDGESTLDELKFITGEIYVQEEQPEDAGEGAIWINPFNQAAAIGEDSPPGVYVIPDWEATEREEGFIKNKPISRGIVGKKFAPGMMQAGQMVQVSEDWYYQERISNITVKLSGSNSYKMIEYYCTGLEDLKQQISENLAVDEIGIFFVRGNVFGFSTTAYVICLAQNSSSDTLTAWLLFISNDSLVSYNGEQLDRGSYLLCTDNGVYIESLTFNYNDFTYNDSYKEIFKDPHASNVYAMDVEALLSESEMGPNTFQVLMAEFNKYEPGSILTVPSVIIQFLEGLMESGGG